MTVNELKAILEDYDNQGLGDADIRTMQQPSWPFEYSIDGVTDTILMDHADSTEEGEPAPKADEPEEFAVYIVEGTQLGYGRGAAWEKR